jgi:hypothetical protein
VDHVIAELGLSERRVCRVLGQHRSTKCKIPTTPDDEATLTADIIALALQYGRYGYRRIAALLRDAGWMVNIKRVERIWRREGLKVPQKQPKKGRLWLNDGVRRKFERVNIFLPQLESIPEANRAVQCFATHFKRIMRRLTAEVLR